MTTREEVKAHILAFVSDSLPPAGPGKRIVADDFDLRRDGAIDSLGLIRLLSDLEARTGKRIDLADVDPEQLTKLGVLAAHIAEQLSRP